jgi:hypothetical protein
MSAPTPLNRNPFVTPGLAINRLAWPSISEMREVLRRAKAARAGVTTGKVGRPPKCSLAEFCSAIPKRGLWPTCLFRQEAMRRSGIRGQASFKRYINRAVRSGRVLRWFPNAERGSFTAQYSLAGGAA